jgi:hypothetical protein
MEKFIWTNHVKNQEALRRLKEDRNILLTIKRRKANRVGHILRRDYLLKHFTQETWEGREEDEENLSSYWIILRIREGTGN